jgi:hypothetical protein
LAGRSAEASTSAPEYQPDFVDPKALRALVESVSKMTLSYPPENNVLSEREVRALDAMKLTATERGGLEKLIAEACAATLFHFFCLMDAVGHPDVVRVRHWSGSPLRFGGDGSQLMLHDAFGDLYWRYKKARAKPSKATPRAGRAPARRATKPRKPKPPS